MFEGFFGGSKEGAEKEKTPGTQARIPASDEHVIPGEKEESALGFSESYREGFDEMDEAKKYICEKLKRETPGSNFFDSNIKLTVTKDTGQVQSNTAGEWSKTVTYSASYEGKLIKNCLVELQHSQYVHGAKQNIIVHSEQVEKQ